MMSVHFMSPTKSSATASRWRRSPSFSRRLTSMKFGRAPCASRGCRAPRAARRSPARISACSRAYSVGCSTRYRTSVGGGLDAVEDFVDGRRQVVDVLAVERGDERAVQAVDDVVHDLVADVLVLEDLAGRPLRSRKSFIRWLEQLARLRRSAAKSENSRKYPCSFGTRLSFTAVLSLPAGAAAYLAETPAHVNTVGLAKRRAPAEAAAAPLHARPALPPEARAPTGQVGEPAAR